MLSPDISIIIPVHNSEAFLTESLKSVQSQTLGNIEIILVENGSSDNSAALCDTLAAEDGRIRVIHLEKGDLSLARNTGISVATGKYIGCVDSDDTILPEMFETMYALAEKNNLGCVCCQFSKVFENGVSVSKFSNNGKVIFCTPAQLTALILMEKTALSACTFLVRKDIYKGISYPVGKAFEDRFTLHRITASCEAGAVINRRFYRYFQRKGSICHTPDYQKYRDACQAETGRLHFIAESSFFSKKEMPRIAARAANLLIKNLRHLSMLATSDNYEEARAIVQGIKAIPPHTCLTLRNSILKKKLMKSL